MWSKMRKMIIFNVDDNLLTGTIPSEIGSLGSGYLDSLELSDNLLTGTLPPELARVNMRTFSVYGNAGLCGKRPWGVSPSLKWFSPRFWTGERVSAIAGTRIGLPCP